MKRIAGMEGTSWDTVVRFSTIRASNDMFGHGGCFLGRLVGDYGVKETFIFEVQIRAKRDDSCWTGGVVGTRSRC